jgi:enamine deaminase RidA (YjgF/YER057c/UK114 family)
MSESVDLTPSGWAPPRGYAHGMVASGKIVTLAGQIGWEPETCTFPTGGFVEQVRQALQNIAVLLREAGASPAHLVRLTWFVTDRDGYLDNQKEIGQAYRELIGPHYPAMSVVIVSALVEEQAMVEIEATAVIPE